jgi:hypothetical protein
VEVENSGNNSLSGEKTTPSRKVLCWKLGGGQPPPSFGRAAQQRLVQQPSRRR